MPDTWPAPRVQERFRSSAPSWRSAPSPSSLPRAGRPPGGEHATDRAGAGVALERVQSRATLAANLCPDRVVPASDPPRAGLARERDPLGLARHAQTFNEAPAQGLKPSAFDPITGTTDQPQEAAQDLPPLEEHLAQVEQEAAALRKDQRKCDQNGWVAIDDRLPAEDKCVLVWVDGGVEFATQQCDQNGWVAIDDRLPAEDKCVLVGRWRGRVRHSAQRLLHGSVPRTFGRYPLDATTSSASAWR